MSIQFKKFLVGLTSLLASVFPVILYAWAYEKIVGLGDSGDDMFGVGILFLSPPIYILSVFLFYKFLKRGFIPETISTLTITKPVVLPLDTRGRATIIMWLITTALISRFSFFLAVLSLIIWVILWYPFMKGLRINSVKQGLFWIGLILFLYHSALMILDYLIY